MPCTCVLLPILLFVVAAHIILLQCPCHTLLQSGITWKGSCSFFHWCLGVVDFVSNDVAFRLSRGTWDEWSSVREPLEAMKVGYLWRSALDIENYIVCCGDMLEMNLAQGIDRRRPNPSLSNTPFPCLPVLCSQDKYTRRARRRTYGMLAAWSIGFNK